MGRKMTAQELTILRDMVYPGRLIIAGRTPDQGNIVVAYGVTGRSSASQARRLVWEGQGLWVKPQDDIQFREKEHELLVYPAILLAKGIAVANGRHAVDIRDGLTSSRGAVDVLASALSKWDYEPDAPIFTPRIGSCVLPDGRAAMGIVKQAGLGREMRGYFEIPLDEGRGWMISTYAGENIDPLPSFAGEPVPVKIPVSGAGDIAKVLYEGLRPPMQEKDFRVGVACVVGRNLEAEDYETSVINRHERT